MAAWQNLPQVTNSSKSPIIKTGVLTIHGFGVRVRMQSGHLEIEDGVAEERRRVRLARVGHRGGSIFAVGIHRPVKRPDISVSNVRA